MKKFIIGFSRPIKPTIFAKIIMRVDGTDYDHVYVKWHSDSIDRDIIYQASKLAVNFESGVTFEHHAIAIEEYEIQLDDTVFKKIVQFCMDNSNEPYSIKQVLGFGWVKLNKKLLNKTVSNPFPANGSEWVCSIIAAQIMIIAGIIETNYVIGNVDPLDLNTIIKSIPAIKRIK
jgi:hypothetical protein